MAEPQTRLILLTAPEAGPDLGARLARAVAAGDVAAVILRLPPGDERALVNAVKAVAPAVQEAGAALVIAGGGTIDLATVAARSGADGVHAEADPGAEEDEGGGPLRSLRERLRDGRILGVGGVRSKHSAMEAGEAGADYILFGDDPGLPLDDLVARLTWWVEIFETPCIALARDLAAVPALAATGAEFIGLDPALWAGDGGEAAAAEAQSLIRNRPAAGEG
ncbi:thiamine phosphate synthase [Methylobacterium nonmethylotrophicum]|uniref:Thiamine phosphate synthase n=1 Tax=Methylobacterium nonmethylotrophicum TaxID=1141884 RepID=A0A4Z0NNC3_9HYPH|nr:thiamine phosphate synthase [Methylobacterium nonmethylotrophicum]TGD98195.1 thiamine phosphate synthase [Methylobacterium nonmethylotrophicum]